MWIIELKRWVADLLSLDRDALHIYVAVIVQLTGAWLMRAPLTSWRPLVPLLVLELVNEYGDLTWEVWPAEDRGRQWLLSAHDVVNTFVMPLVIIALLRLHSAQAAAG